MGHRKHFKSLGVILAAGLLVAGCGSGSQGSSGSTSSGSSTSSGGTSSQSGSSSGSTSTGSTSAAAAFYKGKTITFIVPYSAGGGFDVISRVLAPYLAKYTGAKVAVVNKPGAGGLVGINDMVAAKPDGLTLVVANGPGVSASQVAKAGGVKKAQGMRFDVTKLPWVGRLTGHVSLAYSAPGGKVTSFKSLVGSTGLKFGGTGPGGALQINALEIEDAFNAKLDIINGYKGTSNIEAAVIRHEVDVSMASADGASKKVQAGTITPLFVMTNTPYPFLPKVATLAQVKGAISAKGYALLEEDATVLDATGRGIATTPGTPANRVTFLTAALKKAMSDPGFIAAAKKAHAVPNFLTGAQELSLFQKATNPSTQMRSLILKAYGG